MSSDDASIMSRIVGEAESRLVDLVRALIGGQAKAAKDQVGMLLEGMTTEAALSRVAQWAKAIEKVDLDTLRGLKLVMDGLIETFRETAEKRARGDYEVDEFGLDEGFLDLVRPLFIFLYRKWWRVTAIGVEHVPLEGGALLVANHSGVLPWDGAMIATAMWLDSAKPRIVRALHLDWFSQLPFIAPFMVRTGQVLACPENAERLLRGGHLAAVFPEGVKGVGKLLKDRYKLARFGRGGFVKVGLRARVPIIPVSVVGAEEIYPNILRVDWLGKPIGAPYMPVTPLWPWFGLLGLVPLPTKWTIEFGKPIDTAKLREKDADNFLVVQRLTQRVRDEVQGTINRHLLRRESVFW
ncbi:MAG: acyltransferase family protein [Planctomycetes bacterium]|nr:acyltransferase family protein [Planctomycetota bacterium]